MKNAHNQSHFIKYPNILSTCWWINNIFIQIRMSKCVKKLNNQSIQINKQIQIKERNWKEKCCCSLQWKVVKH